MDHRPLQQIYASFCHRGQKHTISTYTALEGIAVGAKTLLGNVLFTRPTRLPINKKPQSLLASMNYLTPTGPYY